MNIILCGVSLVTLTAISVDRLLALLLGLRYKQVATLKRVYLMTITFCGVSTASSTLRRFFNFTFASLFNVVVVLFCLAISLFSYTTIFLTLRHRRNHVQNHVQQPNQTNQLNIARYRKVVSTVLWLQFMLVACYLPYAISVTLAIHAEPSSSVSLAWSYSFTLICLRTFAPIVSAHPYCARLHAQIHMPRHASSACAKY